MTLDEMAAALAAFFDRTFSLEGHTVHELARLSGGASRETFGFDLVSPDPVDDPWPLILQRVRAGALSSSFTMDGEAALLRAAASGGVPVAPVVASSDDPAIIGAPFLVMERVEGETIARKILREDEFEGARSLLVGQAATALARVHEVPPDVAPHLRADDPVTQLRALLDMLDEPHPAFELAFRWLDDHRPSADVTRSGVVHGDFRLGNLVVDGEGLVAVLDWELAHIGDPMEDLGWLCVRAWRFGADLPVAGMGAYEELFAAYEAASGVAVSHDVVRWWEVLGTLRWGIICILQASGHLSGASRSVELAAIGRRTVENEYDVLRLLGADALPHAPAAVDVGDGHAGYDSGPHDSPTAPQLVEAVREFLELDVLDATSSRVQFHTRVAINVLGIVERELATGRSMAAAHHLRLARLGFHDDRGLADAIRTGALDDRRDEVAAAVYAAVIDKLAVANPTWSD